MHIKTLKLLHFRNYEKLNLEEISPGVNVVYGKNAQGKTNLLEAINLCANGKSFRVRSDSKAIQIDRDVAYAYAEYEKKSGRASMEALLNRDGKKSFKKNGVPVHSLKDMLGDLLAVLFSPEDIRTAKESPTMRRAFLDGEISKIRPSYVDTLKKYAAIVAQKNAALRRQSGKHTESVLRAYNEQLAEHVKTILRNRTAYVNKLNEYVDKTHGLISGGREQIRIAYHATVKEEDIAGQLEALLPRELRDFSCSFGPHRDEAEFRLNGRDVKEFASQGQLRTMMLAVKIACLKILEESAGDTPILLLDDVFSELDAERKENLIKSLAGIQVFLTTAEQGELGGIPGAAGIEVVAGTARSNLRHRRKD